MVRSWKDLYISVSEILSLSKNSRVLIAFEEAVNEDLKESHKNLTGH